MYARLVLLLAFFNRRSQPSSPPRLRTLGVVGGLAGWLVSRRSDGTEGSAQQPTRTEEPTRAQGGVPLRARLRRDPGADEPGARVPRSRSASTRSPRSWASPTSIRSSSGSRTERVPQRRRRTLAAAAIVIASREQQRHQGDLRVQLRRSNDRASGAWLRCSRSRCSASSRSSGSELFCGTRTTAAIGLVGCVPRVRHLDDGLGEALDVDGLGQMQLKARLQ